MQFYFLEGETGKKMNKNYVILHDDQCYKEEVLRVIMCDRAQG